MALARARGIPGFRDFQAVSDPAGRCLTFWSGQRAPAPFPPSSGAAFAGPPLIAPLWKEGIDGSGTTIAVIEGWNDPTIDPVMASFDSKNDLPPADITTAYPNGPLPSACPAGMVALG